jgi:uncharacterized protein (TIGR02246 family)
MRYAKLVFPLLVVVGLIGLIVTSMEAQTDAKKKAAPKAATKPTITPQQPATAKTAPARADEAAEAAIRRLAEAFAVAYNAADARTIAAGFTADGEFVDEQGQVIQGREAIERHFTDVFRELPKARVRIIVESVKLLAPNIAIEEGRVEARPSPEDPSETSQYVALHVRQGEQWLLARTRDFASESAHMTAHDRLRPLEWLVGEWVDENSEARVHTTCKWAEGSSYLVQEFTSRIGPKSVVGGSTRIGWDPLSRQIKSWTFESEGGYGEGLWTQVGDEWFLKSRGVTHDGRITSATIVVRKVDRTTMTWESRDRVVGDEIEVDIGPITVKRRPPAPAR